MDSTSGSESIMPARAAMVRWLGWLCLLAGIAANEWVLTALLSSDGDPHPMNLVKIRLFDVGLIGAGLFILWLRGPVSSPSPLRALLRERPRTIGVLVGALVAVAIVAIAETGFYVANRARRPDTRHEINVTDRAGKSAAQFAEFNESLGYRLVPDRRTRYRFEHEGETIYDVLYTTDEHGRRATPMKQPDARDDFLFCFGGSFTWGQGVEDDETLPAQLARLAPNCAAYNFGYRGYGPQQMLEQLVEIDPAEIPQRDGVAIYTGIDDHIRRAIGGMRTCAMSRRWFPCYTLGVDGRPVREGSFERSRPGLQVLYDVLSRSQTLTYFNVDLPVSIRDAHLQLVVALIEASRDEFREKFGSDRFYVVIYPRSDTLRRIIPMLAERGIAYLDYSDFFNQEEYRSTCRIPHDGHPTPAAYRRLAEQIVADIGLVRHAGGVGSAAEP